MIRDDSTDLRTGPYQRIEIFTPNAYGKGSVVLIDSPGLSEDIVKERVVASYLRETDAILLVVSAIQPISISDIELLTSLRDLDRQAIFVVVNRIDMVRQEDLEPLKQFVTRRLATLLQDRSSLYFVSAIEALDGRLQANVERLNNSGLLGLEQSLMTYLVNVFGRDRLRRLATRLLIISEEAENAASVQEKSLDIPLNELHNRQDQSRRQLAEVETTTQRFTQKVGNLRNKTCVTVNSMALRHYDDLELKIDTWLVEYQPNTNYGSQF